jgi:hypothetical protein
MKDVAPFLVYASFIIAVFSMAYHSWLWFTVSAVSFGLFSFVYKVLNYPED